MQEEESYDDQAFRFIDEVSGAEFPYEQIFYEGEQVKPGDVIELHVPEEKTAYYNVDSVEEGEAPTVYLVRARNSTWKFVMLAAILGGSWFVIDYIFDLLFKS